MKVVCIDTEIISGKESPIVGKIYDVDRSDIYSHKFVLYNRYVTAKLFITLEEYRERQLNKLI